MFKHQRINQITREQRTRKVKAATMRNTMQVRIIIFILILLIKVVTDNTESGFLYYPYHDETIRYKVRFNLLAI